MKKFLLTAIAVFSIQALACEEAVIDIAQTNLDQKAKAYGFEGSFIVPSSISRVSATSDTQTYSLSGFIYKASYDVEVRVDSSCSLESLEITHAALR